jgi:preprotein translocase subunit SecG
MTTVLLVIHLMITVALVGIILMQRSEGGALGIGGGGDGFMSGRGAANLLTRTTAILAVVFFVTSLLLAMLAGIRSTPTPIAPSQATQQEGTEKASDSTPGNLPKLAPLAPAKKPDAAKPDAPKPDAAKSDKPAEPNPLRPQ